MDAYQKAINETSAKHAPWYVIPADIKWLARMAAIQIIVDNLEDMKLKFPELPQEEMSKLQQARLKLESE